MDLRLVLKNWEAIGIEKLGLKKLGLKNWGLLGFGIHLHNIRDLRSPDTRLPTPGSDVIIKVTVCFFVQ